MKYLTKTAIFALSLMAIPSMRAGVITSPVSVVSNSGGEAAAGDIAHIIDRSGLTPGFTSGVTDFDTYIAGNPRHTTTYSGFEWFGTNGVLSATIVLDMGSISNLSRIAFWNEEFSGSQSLTIFSCPNSACLAGTNLGSFSPINNPTASGAPTYGAEVFDFADVSTRYVRLDVTGPQANDDGWKSPSIGELAFDVTTVPEPSSLLLMLGALPLAFAAHRNSRNRR